MITPNSPQGKTPALGTAWRARAEELAGWTMARMVNRNDRCGGSYVDKEDGLTKRTTRPSNGAQPGYVSLQLLARHFRATVTADVIGLHALGTDSTGRWLGIDIDAHEGDTADPAQNLQFTFDLYAELVGFGFRPLLYESNGTGGYHLLTLFDEPVGGPLLFTFGQWLVRGFGRYGMTSAPEVFPKQRRLDSNTEFGNWLRVIGRHHKREFWPRVWDGSNWLADEAAVEHVLSLTGDSPAQIPESALEYDPEPLPAPKKATARGKAKRSVNIAPQVL